MTLHIRQGVFETNSSSTHGFVVADNSKNKLSYTAFEVMDGVFPVKLHAFYPENDVVYTQLDNKLMFLLSWFKLLKFETFPRNATKQEVIAFFYQDRRIAYILKLIERLLGVPLELFYGKKEHDQVSVPTFDGSIYAEESFAIYGSMQELYDSYDDQMLHEFFFYSKKGIYVYRDENGLSATVSSDTSGSVSFLPVNVFTAPDREEYVLVKTVLFYIDNVEDTALKLKRTGRDIQVDPDLPAYDPGRHWFVQVQNKTGTFLVQYSTWVAKSGIDFLRGVGLVANIQEMAIGKYGDYGQLSLTEHAYMKAVELLHDLTRHMESSIRVSIPNWFANFVIPTRHHTPTDTEVDYLGIQCDIYLQKTETLIANSVEPLKKPLSLLYKPGAHNKHFLVYSMWPLIEDL